MKSFTSLTKKKKKEDLPSEVVYKGDYLSVVKIEEWEVVSERDCVVVIPYFPEYNEFLIRKEHVPPYQHVDKQDFFITVVSGVMEDGERPEDTMRRELEEETGIRLNSGYTGQKKWNTLFLNKGNTSKCHIFFVSLTHNDFQKVMAKGDGSRSEAMSSTVRVDTKYLEHLKTADVLTTLCIEYLKNELRLS
jgi:8-oxo-dGTP pyrophosphatase MutT (NUDIX family)